MRVSWSRRHLSVIPSHYVELANTPSAIENWRLPPGLVPEDLSVMIKRDDRTGFGLSGSAPLLHHPAAISPLSQLPLP